MYAGNSNHVQYRLYTEVKVLLLVSLFVLGRILKFNIIIACVVIAWPMVINSVSLLLISASLKFDHTFRINHV